MLPGYVVTSTGTVLVLLPARTPEGFLLTDGERSWPGAVGVDAFWEQIDDDDPQITAEDRLRLASLLTAARSRVPPAR